MTTDSNPVILCLDDERMILTSLQAQLQRNFGPEFQYEFAESPDEAFEIMKELAEDKMSIILIISDWLMPKMKGDEFLIQVHHDDPKIIKIMLTGQADENAISRAYQDADLFKCIQKPWDEQELVASIREAIDILKKNGD